MLNLADAINVWGLLVIGSCLMAGLFEKWVSIGAMVLIGLYYFSHPPLVGFKFDAHREGSYLLVN